MALKIATPPRLIDEALAFVPDKNVGVVVRVRSAPEKSVKVSEIVRLLRFTFPVLAVSYTHLTLPTTPYV